jgi:hypothetical protein
MCNNRIGQYRAFIVIFDMQSVHLWYQDDIKYEPGRITFNVIFSIKVECSENDMLY